MYVGTIAGDAVSLVLFLSSILQDPGKSWVCVLLLGMRAECLLWTEYSWELLQCLCVLSGVLRWHASGPLEPQKQ